MATKTQTPIEALSGAIDMFHEVHHPEVPRFLGCTHEVCTDARAAPEDVEALVRALENTIEEIEKTRGQGWCIQARTALAKFQAQL